MRTYGLPVHKAITLVFVLAGCLNSPSIYLAKGALMKKRNMEHGGSIEIVIISVLVVGILAILGFVFWQNFINKPDNKSNETTAPVTDGSLSISEWGVKGTYSNTDVQLEYSLETRTDAKGDEYQQIGLTDRRIAHIDSCSASKGPAGYVSRLSADSSVVTDPSESGPTTLVKDLYSDSPHISSYYYVWQGPHSPCGQEDTWGISSAAANAASEFAKNLQAINP